MLDPNFVLDDDGRERLITRFGAGVDAWCAVLPEMVELYCLRWHLALALVPGHRRSPRRPPAAPPSSRRHYTAPAEARGQ
jgi:hypothetical protein